MTRCPASRWAWIISTVAALGAGAGARVPARRSPPTTRRSTSATTSGCSGSTWRVASTAGAGDRASPACACSVRVRARQVRQPAAAQAGGDLRARRRGAGRADLHRELPVRLAQHRELVRRQGRRRARRRPEPRPRHARHARQRPRRPRPGWPPSGSARAGAVGRAAGARAAARAALGAGRSRSSARAGQTLLATGSSSAPR